MNLVARTLTSIATKQVLILGGGISGKAAALFAASLGAKVALSNDRELAADDTTQLSSMGIEIKIGKQTASLIDDIDILITSPGISESHPTIAAARAAQLCVATEIDLALAHFSGPIIAITGTNGKSTTTSMSAHMLNAIGIQAVACGNIGLAPSQLLYEQNTAKIWVIELSSYQIEGSQDIEADVVVFTSFSQDHVARHGTIENYFLAKWKLCRNLKANGLLVMSASALAQAKKQQLKFPHILVANTTGFDFTHTRLLTKHDQLNAVFAATAVRHIAPQMSIQNLIDTLANFQTLEFRYQPAGTISQQLVINDSKSTNVESVVMALENQSRPVLLLLGGQGKGESFVAVKEYRKQIGEIWCFGAEGPKIYNELSDSIPCKLFSSLKSALAELKPAIQRLQMNVLFSPGCASFDEFKNFTDRGQFFNQEVNRYADSRSSE